MQVYQNYIFLIPHNFIKSFFSNKKSPSAKTKGREIVRLPRHNDFRTFCIIDETEKVYRKLEEVIEVY